METVEVVAALLFTIVVAALIIAFLTGFDFNSVYKYVNNLINPQPSFDYVKEVDMYGFAQTAYDCWQGCDRGLNDKNCGAVLLKATTEYPQISKPETKAFFEKISLCSDCNLSMSDVPVALPHVLSINCRANSLKIDYFGMCFPKNCAQLGKQCGTWDNGCGTPIDCGTTCPAGLACDFATGQCACAPKTCAILGKECWTWDNGCGTPIDCGTTCPTAGEICNTSNGQCETTTFDLEIENVTVNSASSTFAIEFCVHGNKSINELKPSIPGLVGLPRSYALFEPSGNKVEGRQSPNYSMGPWEDLKNGQCGTIAGIPLAAEDMIYFNQTKKLEVTLDGIGIIPEANEANNTFLYQECIPKTCVQLGKECWTWDNGCGTPIDCGTTCPVGEICNTSNGQCETTTFDLEAKTLTRETPTGYIFMLNFCVHGNKSINDLKPTIPGLTGLPFTYAAFDSSGNRYAINAVAAGGVEIIKNGACTTFGFGITPAQQAYFNDTKKVEAKLDGVNIIPETDENNNTVLYQECTPQTCASLGKECWTWDNGCGTPIDCGTCPAGKTCNNATGQCYIPSQTCIDSDKTVTIPDGKNPYLKGVTQGYNIMGQYTTYTDNCIHSNTAVMEFVCVPDQTVTTYNINCTGSCSDGACQEQRCVDSDGGLDYNTSGSAEWYRNGVMMRRDLDTCIDYDDPAHSYPAACYTTPGGTMGNGKCLTEIYCQAGGTAIGTDVYICPGMCSNRACVSTAVPLWIQVGPPHNASNSCDNECLTRGLQCKSTGCTEITATTGPVTGGNVLKVTSTSPPHYHENTCSYTWGTPSFENYCCCGS